MSAGNRDNKAVAFKWKLFRFVNYLQILLTTAIFALVTVGFLNGGRHEDLGWILLTLFCCLVVIANDFFNLHLMNRYFPDQQLPSSTGRAEIFFLIGFILITLAELFLSIAGFSSELSAGRDGDYTGFVVLGILFFHAAIGAFILVVQARLPLFIERNNQVRMRRLIDEIGSSANP